MYSQARMRFAQNLRLLRRLRDLSQEQLALEAGISRVYLGDIERGKRAVTIDVMEKLAEALHIDLGLLLSQQFLQEFSVQESASSSSLEK